MRRALGISCVAWLIASMAAAGHSQELPAVSNEGLASEAEAQPGAVYSDQDLSGTSWPQADLRGARFANCVLDGADLSGAFLGGAAFEGCSLKDARFTSASMRGVYLSACDLSGATFDGADLAGATLLGLTLSPTGAPYLPALHTAIELRGGTGYSPALIAAASGDAFSLAYNRNNRGDWAGRPVTFNPLLVALDTLGFDATTPKMVNPDAGTARANLVGVLRRGLVAILPLSLAGAGLEGDAVEGPVWVVAHDLTSDNAKTEQVHLATPFGPMTLETDDLLGRWQGPWPTLAPVGETLSEARYPMVMVGAMKAEITEPAAIVEALRHGSAIMNEARVFGESHGGLQAYEALLKDFGDTQVPLDQLAAWAEGPRLGVAASRKLAANFLREAAPKLPEPAQRPLLEAADLYAEVANLLANEWPLVSDFVGAIAMPADVVLGQRRGAACTTLQATIEAERRAAALLDQAVAEAVRAP